MKIIPFILFGLLSTLTLTKTPGGNNSNNEASTQNQNCQRSSADWENRYRHLESYIPVAEDPIITIHCNIIVWQDEDGTTNWQDTPEHRERLNNLFHHPTLGLNFQMYERYIPPTDPVIPPEEEVHTKNIRFQLEGIYFFRDSALTRSIGINDKRRYLQKNGYEHLLDEVNINITTSPGPVEGAWGHAEYPGFTDNVPMITTTDDPNQKGYDNIPIEGNTGYPVSIASYDGKEYHREWSFMEHLAHELGHCLDLKHVYAGRVAMGYEDCQTSAHDYMDDIFPETADWCGKPRPGCEVCLQQSSYIAADKFPDDGMTNNLMNGRGGRYLSPKQLGKIHRAFATKSMALASTGYSSAEIEVGQDETWDFGMQVYRPLRIRAGHTLTIKCELRMPQEGYILIEQGARLIIDGGVITKNQRAEYWQGIRLKKPKKQKNFIELKNGGLLNHVRSS